MEACAIWCTACSLMTSACGGMHAINSRCNEFSGAENWLRYKRCFVKSGDDLLSWSCSAGILIHGE